MEGIKRKVPGDGKMEFKWVKEKILLGDSESFDGTTMVQFLEKIIILLKKFHFDVMNPTSNQRCLKVVIKSCHDYKR